MIERTAILRTYLRWTALWPQKRWAIATALYSQVVGSPAPQSAYALLMSTHWTATEYHQVVETMTRAHRLARIERQLQKSDVLRDWANTKGAVTKHVLSKSYSPTLESLDYQSLQSDACFIAAHQKLRTTEPAGPFSRAVMEISTLNELALLFRIGFADESTYISSLRKPVVRRSAVRYGLDRVPQDELSEMAWTELGRRVRCAVPDLRHSALWGFKDMD